MYDLSPTKSDEPSTVYIRPTYVASGALIAILISTYLPYKFFPDVPWPLALFVLVMKLALFSMNALLYWTLPEIRPDYKQVRQTCFIAVVALTPGALIVTIPFDFVLTDRARAAWAVAFVCDVVTFLLTKRCGRPSFCPTDEEWALAAEKLDPGRSAQE
ncbi:hypothetical protein MKEN_00754600 [Mycena kentingensis (nom. inval.)]|nr:hypothetical protein MKEN_00754600 [Mycena kentingensis (nom. inval.)]